MSSTLAPDGAHVRPPGLTARGGVSPTPHRPALRGAEGSPIPATPSGAAARLLRVRW